MKAMSALWMVAAVGLWWAGVVGVTAGVVGCHRQRATEAGGPAATEPPVPVAEARPPEARPADATASGGQPAPKARLAREVPPAEVGDYQEFVKKLKETVPIDMKDFARPRVAMPAGVAVDDYTPCPRYDGLVNRVQLRIEPGVWLKDAVTGKTAKYTRAVMVRNNPAPSRYPEPFAWIVVNLLP